MTDRILVATDGSSAAQRAAEIAADLARARDLPIILLSVVDDRPVPESLRHLAEVEHMVEAAPQPAGPNMANVPSWMVDGVRAAAVAEEGIGIRRAMSRVAIDKAKECMARLEVETVQPLVEEGDAAETILNVAAREGAGLIVMGTRGLGGLKGILQGSVSKAVCERAACPCVTVT